MKTKKILRDKIDQARVKPSDRTWDKVENGLDKKSNLRKFKQRSVIGWAAVALMLILSYFVGRQDVNSQVYAPKTLEIYDQEGSQVHFTEDLYYLPVFQPNYRKDGRLVPNYQTLWENPLVARERNL